MSNILGLWGQNFSNGTEELIAVWGKAAMVRRSSQWILTNGYITAGTKCELESFLDCAFMVTGVDANQCYDGSHWSTIKNLGDSPKAYFLKRYNVRLYLGNITIGSTAYPSRVWFSDLPIDKAIKWGLETGSDLSQTAGSAVVTSAGSAFKGVNIKTGDPFTIEDGDNKGEYVVQSIDSQTQITLTETLEYTATNSTFWVGGNYFDVETDDGDTIQAFRKNSNELLIFKKNSLHRFSGQGGTLRQVKGVPGTTSRRGVIDVGQYTYYYHPTGIYRVGLPDVELISNPIYDFIEGVTSANQTKVITWQEDEKKAVFFLGDVTLRDGTVISDCAVVFDTTIKAWSARSYKTTFQVATNWLESNVPTVYTGDDADSVFKMNTGNDFDDVAIPCETEFKPIFPAGEDVIVDFTRLRAYIENGPDVQFLFKLYYKPTGDEDRWVNDEDWTPMKGSQRADKMEWRFPEGTRASGVALKAVESSSDESFLLEKLVIYFSNPAIL